MVKIPAGARVEVEDPDWNDPAKFPQAIVMGPAENDQNGRQRFLVRYDNGCEVPVWEYRLRVLQEHA